MRGLITRGFEVKNGKVYGRGDSIPKYDLQEFNTWGGSPEYKVYGCWGSDYNIKKDAYNDWWLYDGYSQICRLYYHGGNHWTSY